jgi:hypothetical protein
MPRPAKSLQDSSFYTAALEGLELQRRRIEEQIQHVRALLGVRRGRAAAPALAGSPVRKRRLSAAARKRIAMAQKRRWAEYRRKAAAKGE